MTSEAKMPERIYANDEGLTRSGGNVVIGTCLRKTPKHNTEYILATTHEARVKELEAGMAQLIRTMQAAADHYDGTSSSAEGSVAIIYTQLEISKGTHP